MSIATQQQPSTATWLGWGAFLGMSWTWCIGMFLPVILIRDYGIWGWIVFAIPNVLGAAMMGRIIESPHGSIEITTPHRLACQLFSAVTIAFHLFFTVVVISPLAQRFISGQGSAGTSIISTFVVTAIMSVYLIKRSHRDRIIAWLVLLVSILAMLFALPQLLTGWAKSPIQPLPGTHPSDLLWLALICAFGFFLCPYLDLTFHRARRSTSRPVASFTTGFGIFFLLMILFTLLYSPTLVAGSMSRGLALLLLIHMTIQSAFTMAAHVRELYLAPTNLVASLIIAFLAIGAWLAYWSLPAFPLHNQISSGELIYRTFLGFYALICPAYVWLIILPARTPAAGASGSLMLFWIAIIIALPMFAAAFLLQKGIWLGPGLAVVLLARLALRFTPAQMASFLPTASAGMTNTDNH